ncbi:MAG: hypothetical protein WC967_15610 [Balneolaceae bacterium]
MIYTWNKSVAAVVALLYLVALYLVVFHFNPWFNATLYRHIAMQFPLLILLGCIAGYFLFRDHLESNSISIHFSVIFFFIGSLAFWMLPVSIDSAAINNKVDMLLSMNLWISGLLLASQFRKMPPELKFTFLFFLSSMIFITGAVLGQLNLLLCGAYTLLQQKILGTYLFKGGIVLLVFSVIYLGTKLARIKPEVLSI